MIEDLDDWKFVLIVVLSILPAPTWAQEKPFPDQSGFRGSDQPSSVRGTYSTIFRELERYWTHEFEKAGLPYRPPEIVLVTDPIETACGPIWPHEENAYYCAADETIYLLPRWLDDQTRKIGDYAPVEVAAHEWGHHIQWLLAVGDTDSETFERQADCLSGAFTAHAEASGLLDPGDFIEAINFMLAIGDDSLGLPVDNPDAHGSAEERLIALTKGFGGGPVTGCGLPIGPEDVTPTPTPTPIPTPTPDPPVLVLPFSPPVQYGSCFSINLEEAFDLDDLTERLGGTQDARLNLLDWGWQTSVRRAFGCGGLPPGKAGWIDIYLHLFSSSTAARQAVDYFAAQRIEGTKLESTGTIPAGDFGIGIQGPAVNGTESTVYASQGPVVIRVTGVSPSGAPTDDVVAVAQSVLAAQFGGEDPEPFPTPTLPIPAPSSLDYLPASPALNYAACFQTRDSGAYSQSDVPNVFAHVGLSPIDARWMDGAYVVFSCAEPPPGRASQLDVVIHQFRDAQAAQQAMPLAKNMYIPGENEKRACETAGDLIVCVTGRSITGSPLTDVYFVLNQVVGGWLGAQARNNDSPRHAPPHEWTSLVGCGL